MVSNIVAGESPQNSNNYCFAIGLKEADQLGEIEKEKTTDIKNLKWQCFNFHFTPPVFAGPNIGNCSATSTSFNTSFELPREGLLLN